MIGDHIKIVMEYLNALRVPHYKKKSHHRDRCQDEKPPKQRLGDRMQRSRGDVHATQRPACNKCSRLVRQRWSHFPEQNGGLAKVDSGLDYAANFFSFACVA